jgi:hypothetical protein
MNRAWNLAAGLNRRTFLALSAAIGVGAAGCKNTDPLKKVVPRLQMAEDPGDTDTVVTVGSKTTVGNTESLVVSGVGLVYQLPGTGSSPAPGTWRTMLEENLKKMKKDQSQSVKELLDGPGRSTSLVIVTAMVPPGVRKDEPIDVQVTLPDESRTTSLLGGVLFPCELLTSDTTGNVRSQLHNGTAAPPSGRLLLGSAWAKVETPAPLVAGNFVPDTGRPVPENTDGEGRPLYRAGLVASGARATAARPYYLILNPNDQNPRIAAAIAERLNTTFHTSADPNMKVAEAKTKELILVNVPTAYRHNHYRFLLVARQVPYAPVSAAGAYRQKLEEELMDASTAVTAAVKLEALGGDCRRSLRVGMESPSPWVRFAAAEALAYLGQTDGAGELARLAEDHPALRPQCLTALVSMNDAAGTDRLVDLLASADPEMRQGAFIALRMADERHPALNGTLMNRSYWLYRAAPEAPAAVHLTTTGRSTIVLFGDGVALRGPVPPIAVGSEFTVSVPLAPAGTPVTARVTRVVKARGGAEVEERRCAPTLAGVLTAMANLGGGFAEAIELVRKADRAEALSGKLVIDAIPRELSIQQLSGFAKIDPTLAKANVEVTRVGTVRPAVDANGFELPTGTHDPQVAPAGAPLAKPPLNRDPGRLFGPKRTPDAPTLDPVVVPAGGQ